MGLFQGSMSLSRYRLVGSSSRSSLAELSRLLDPYRAGDIELEGVGTEEQAGWTRPQATGQDDPDAAGRQADEDGHWDLGDCQVAGGFLLRMRIERRKVPSTLLQHCYKRELAARVARTGKALPPQARRDLRDHLQRELLKRALPTLSFVDGFWREADGELLVFAMGKRLRASFEALFLQTFAAPLSLTLVALEPPLMGLSPEHWREDSQVASETLGRLSLATPVAFAVPAHP